MVCMLAHTVRQSDQKDTAMANAHLIAAAPEMLKALQRLTHPSADDDDLAYALEVIAKATGGAV